jgi:G3E family GTPase
LLTGADRDAKSAYLRALLTLRPAHAHWAVLDNDENQLDRNVSGLPIASVSGCACCTGQIMLQTGLVRLLRDSPTQGLVIIAAAAAEPAALMLALQQKQLAPALSLRRNQCIAAPTLLDSSEAARALWLRQMLAADDVIVPDERTATALETQSLRVIGFTEAVALALAGLARATGR